MKKTLSASILACICGLAVHAQAVYVDSKLGDDNNEGTKEAPVFSIYKAVEIIKSKDNDIYTIKINPGIYVLDSHLSVTTEKDMTDKRIVIEASILPDSSSWTPEKMPIIINTSMKGEIPGEDYSYVISFLINESHVTIRGIKFHGYFYPNSRYFPIARLNKTKTDLFVEQCMFVGDKDASHIQVGVIAHGNEINVDHCVFYNAKNTVVFWEDAGDNIKHGNRLTNSIILGAYQSAVWVAWPDEDFVFENNIVSNCKHVWVKDYFNTTTYAIDNCVLVNNQFYKGVCNDAGVVSPVEFKINENNVIKDGTISLRLIDDIDKPFPIDYLHIIPGSLGYDIGAGLFKKKITSTSSKALTNPEKIKLIQNYPNPFNQITVIKFNIPESGFTKLMIYNLSGQEIETLINEYKQAGKYEIIWTPKGLPGGTYFCKLQVVNHSTSSGEQFTETAELILQK